MAGRHLLIGTLFDDFQRVSVETQAASEHLAVFSGGNALQLDFGNTFSILSVVKSDETEDQYMVNLGGIGDIGVSGFNLKGEDQSNRIEVRMSENGVVFKHYFWNNRFVPDVWHQYIVTWDGTNLNLYDQGVLRTVSQKATDNAGTMADDTRELFIGAFGPNGDTGWKGNQMMLAFYDFELTAGNVTTLYNGGDVGLVDLRTQSFTGPVHWWRFGHDESDIGRDYGSVGGIDALSGSANVDASDIEKDVQTS